LWRGKGGRTDRTLPARETALSGRSLRNVA
jgi:hypothetical protein